MTAHGFRLYVDWKAEVWKKFDFKTALKERFCYTEIKINKSKLEELISYYMIN